MSLIPVQDYILPSRLGLGINFQWIPLGSYNDTQFDAVALFVVTPAPTINLGDIQVMVT